jgi:Glycosyl hydrolase catalytic core/Carbohydrate binding module (family 6)
MDRSLTIKRLVVLCATAGALAFGAGCAPHASVGQVTPATPSSKNRSAAAVKAAVAAGETAYPNGTAWPLPGTIDFDNYDIGGEGVAYHTQNTTNPGGQYRTDGVGIEKDTDTGNGNGFDVGWNNNGNWYKYSVKVQTGATYPVALRLAASNLGTLHIEDETGINLTGEIPVSATGGFQSWATFTSKIALTAGNHILKVVIDSGNGSFNLNDMTLGSPSPTATPTPIGSPSPSAKPSPIPSPSAIPTASPVAGTKSAKRGLAYDLANSADLAAVAPGVSWFYNWATTPNTGLSDAAIAASGVEYDPMLWNGNFVATAVESWLSLHRNVHYILVMNEPNLTSQANLTPQQAAQIWPRYEAVAAAANVKIVGPAITWGDMANYNDPVAWLDAFYAAYQANNGGRKPQIDYLAFHWYDYGLSSQLDRLTKYGKPFWVTEFANWHSQLDGAQIDTLAKQEAQMTDMVNTCETRTDVFRYAWFTGRISPDPHFDSLLGATGQLTALGSEYLTLPHS